MTQSGSSFKILILGETRLGMSSILNRLTEKSFAPYLPPTLGIDYKLFADKIDGKDVRLQIWDTAGQERFRTIAETFYRQSDGILVVFDVTDEDSFEKVNFWLDSLREKVDPSCVVVLVGNKADLKEETGVQFVPEANIQQLCRSTGFKYFEVSAKTNLRIYDTFHHLAEAIATTKTSAKSETEISISGKDRKAKPIRCCE